ncbi:MAG: hypothetical protein PHF84_10185 [bacterium]|nr:hypothetical protein [bacterium]
MKQMIDEILKKETDLRNDIASIRSRAEEIKKTVDNQAVESINQTIQEGQKESEDLIKRTVKEIRDTEKEQLKQVEAMQEFKIPEKKIDDTAAKIISRYIFKEK